MMPLFFTGQVFRGIDKTQFSRKAKPWAYWGQHDDLIVVMPPGTGEEIKNADMTKLNFLKAAEDVRSACRMAGFGALT